MKNIEKDFLEKFIENNCENYKRNFYKRKPNKFADYCFRVLEKKLLRINYFCYFLNYSFCEAIRNSCYYLRLSKSERKCLSIYHKSIIKIYMHIDCIFIEIANVRKFINKSSNDLSK